MLKVLYVVSFDLLFPVFPFFFFSLITFQIKLVFFPYVHFSISCSYSLLFTKEYPLFLVMN